MLGKFIGWVSRVLSVGGGSTLPGRLARYMDPGFVTEMAGRLAKGCLLVTGTNGKTTTSALIASILRNAGMPPVHNSTGANLMAGIASAFIRESDRYGHLPCSIGLFEVDEATLPAAISETSPRLVLINNLFRDQLDRYGELDTLASRMEQAVAGMEANSIVVLNADDPLVASIGRGLKQEVVYYGLEGHRYASTSMQHAADSKHCSDCGHRLEYEYYLFGHMGAYRCPSCGLERPHPRVAATGLKMEGMKGTRCTVTYPGGSAEVFVPLPGLYNVYNALAAVTATLSLGVDPETVFESMQTFTAAFGRVERVSAGDRDILVILAKNPAGFNEVIRTLCEEPSRKTVLLALNDLIADGRDVSWIWDVDFEMFRGKVGRLICSGIRALDMALRVKHAEMEQDSLQIEKNLAAALDLGLGSVDPGETLYVVPTYTAMLELRRVLASRGLVAPYWEG